MRVVNETHWRTDQLKAIIERVAKTALEGYAKRKKRLVITVTYSKETNHTGHASLGGTRMTLRIPKANVNKPEFAHLVDHEMGHIRGQGHRQMTQPEMWYTCWKYPICEQVNKPKYAWVDTMPLEPKCLPSKPTVDLQVVRYQRTLEAQKRWEEKLKKTEAEIKRIKTELTKLKERRRYYEKEVFEKRQQEAAA